MGFVYRKSTAPEDLIFVSAVLEGAAGNPAEIKARMEALVERREASQPVKTKTGGSTFKNPPGHKAWQLIDEAGGRGLRRGGAQVSELHCNFLINTGRRHCRRYRRPRRRGACAGQGKIGRRARMGNQAGGRAVSEFKKIAVLMGGLSAERDVSLSSGKGCARGTARGRLRGRRDRSQGRRSFRAVARRQARLRVQRPARPLGRGWLRARSARTDAHSLHPFRRAGFGAVHAQGAHQDVYRAAGLPVVKSIVADRRRGRGAAT